MDEVAWLDGGREFVWVSEGDGWRHAYAVKRDGSGKRLLTKFDGDLASISRGRRRRRELYFIASPANARSATSMRRDSTATEPCGASRPRTSPARTATTFHRTAAGRCTRGHRSRTRQRPRSSRFRTIDPCGCWSTTRPSRSKVAPIIDPPVEFLKVTVDDGVVLDGYMLKPKAFDASRKYRSSSSSTANLPA